MQKDQKYWQHMRSLDIIEMKCEKWLKSAKINKINAFIVNKFKTNRPFEKRWKQSFFNGPQNTPGF